MGFTVGLMYNLGKYDRPGPGEPPDAHAELDSEETVNAIADALRTGGHSVLLIEGNEEAFQRLRELRPQIVFNICEGVRGASRESHIPAILEMLGIPFTGAGVLGLAVSLDKAVAKKLLRFHGVPTPEFRTIAPGEIPEWNGLRFPLFVKPALEGSSKGITPASRVESPAELTERVLQVHRLYRQPALVEEFVGGREFTVGIVGNEPPFVLPIMEICFDSVPDAHGPIYSYQFKQEWDDWSYYRCPAEVDDTLAESLRQMALAAMRALGCVDVARVDLRLGSDGVPYVLEVNPLPGLSPGFSDLARQAERAGWSYSYLVNAILDAGLVRNGLLPPAAGLADTAD